MKGAKKGQLIDASESPSFSCHLQSLAAAWMPCFLMVVMLPCGVKFVIFISAAQESIRPLHGH